MRPAWLPEKPLGPPYIPNASIDIIASMQTRLVAQDALSQASAIMALESKGLLRHYHMAFGTATPEVRARWLRRYCPACQGLAWAHGVLGPTP